MLKLNSNYKFMFHLSMGVLVTAGTSMLFLYKFYPFILTGQNLALHLMGVVGGGFGAASNFYFMSQEEKRKNKEKGFRG